MSLTKIEIEEYKKHLEKMRNAILKALHGAAAEVKDVDETGGYSQHQADHATDDFDLTINMELTNNELEILRQIEKALEKIRDGSYGICEISGKPIPKKRLDAIPYATMTVEAQQMLEKGLI